MAGSSVAALALDYSSGSPISALSREILEVIFEYVTQLEPHAKISPDFEIDLRYFSIDIAIPHKSEPHLLCLCSHTETSRPILQLQRGYEGPLF